MSDGLIAFLILYIGWMFASTIIYVDGFDDTLDDFKEPLIKLLYEQTTMNIVGCIITAFLLYFLFPIVLIPREVFAIFYWLFHIGRKQ